MAYEKVITYKIKCAGPCGSPALEVSRIPEDWRRMKVHRVSQKSGTNPIVGESLLCPVCAVRAVSVLEECGFVFDYHKFESRKTSE